MINYNNFNKYSEHEKQEFIDKIRNIPTLKQFYLMWLEDNDVNMLAYPILSIITPIAYYIQRHKAKKFLKENSEYLI